jgi:hypothetical protein
VSTILIVAATVTVGIVWFVGRSSCVL